MCLGSPGSLRSLSNSHMGPHTRHLTVSFFAQQCDAQYQRPQDVSRVSLTRPDRQSTQSRRLSTTVGPTDRWDGPQPAHNAWYTAHAGPVQQHPAQTHCAAQANAAARTRMQTRQVRGRGWQQRCGRRRSRRRTTPVHSEHKHACEMVPSSHREWEDVAHEGGKGGRTFAPVDALAVQEDPPSPAARLGPIHWMGRAVRSQAHALSGHTMQALRPLKLSCDACAHARIREPSNASRK